MGDGLDYFCRRYGEDGYCEHVARHANTEEVSNCSGFQAMFLKRTKGLHTTGVVLWESPVRGTTCSSRMGLVTYSQCNIDFVVLAALMMAYFLWLMMSYDIACQYVVYFWDRMMRMPEAMRLKIPKDNLWTPEEGPFGIFVPLDPVNHGETIEQNWEFLNGAAASTRLMGPGSRQATLADIFGFHNYEKNSLSMWQKRIALPRCRTDRDSAPGKESTGGHLGFDSPDASGFEPETRVLRLIVKGLKALRWKIFLWSMDPRASMSMLNIGDQRSIGQGVAECGMIKVGQYRRGESQCRNIAAEVKFTCRQTAAAMSHCRAVTPSKCRHTAAACGRLPLKITRLPLQSANFAAVECCRLPLHNVCLCFGAAILPQSAAA
ncbi:hypothetical protein B0H14DRAFT_2556655 [Mycena olivaceomarginata]|nr:hypothetical protein B0H14DRAFT_2556655 [Mycena olivaceomarginata]